MQARLRLHAAPATFVSLAAILTLAVVGVAVLGGGKADAVQQVSCGDTITTDATLHHNLVNCPNNGIIIGADDVTLDLNYHTIDGDGEPFKPCSEQFCDVGVLNTGHDGDTVVHGSVRQFGDGVIVGTSRHTRLLGVSSSSNQFSAIVLTGCARSLVRNSSGSGSVADGQGLFLTFSHHVRILHSSFRNNGFNGIGLFESSHNLITGNRLSGNGAGIDLDSDRNRVSHNRVRDGAIGISVGGERNVIARNRVSHLRQPGRGDGVAIEVGGGDRNVISGNSVRDTEGDAIRAGFEIHVVGTVVRGNHIRGAGGDGVDVGGKAKHSRLKRNHAFGAKDDGLDTNDSTTKLTRNEARRNGDLGIEAVRGVADGGGNGASGNGDPRQCTQVVCR